MDRGSRIRFGAPSLALVLCLCASCGTAQNGAVTGAVYKEGGAAFHVPPVPSTWARIKVDDAALAFRDEAHDASVLVNARCGQKDEDTPLVALTNHLVMGTTEREPIVEETIPFDRREARHTRMNAKLDGVLMSFDIFVLKKDGCVYDFVYVAPPDKAEGGIPEFERFVHGFRTVSPGES